MRTLLERYYTQYYHLWGSDESTEDVYVNQHTNDLVVIGLAPSHPALQKKITKIDYKSITENKGISGTKKNGASRVQRDTIIASVTCDDGTEYNIRASCKGKLLEVNNTLLKNPEILSKHAETSGFLVIIEPVIKESFMDNVGLVKFTDFHALRNIPIQKGPVFLKESEDSLAD